MRQNKVSNLFRANTDSISDVNKRNILSTWKTILGGLKNHKQNDFVNKYGYRHMIRQIDGYSKFISTKRLRALLDKENIDHEKYLKTIDRIRINKELKMKGISDRIQIEHLSGGVNSLVDRLIAEKNPTLKSLKAIHYKHTLCCYKLTNSESHINHKLKLDKIQI